MLRWSLTWNSLVSIEKLSYEEGSHRLHECGHAWPKYVNRALFEWILPYKVDSASDVHILITQNP